MIPGETDTSLTIAGLIRYVRRRTRDGDRRGGTRLKDLGPPVELCATHCGILLEVLTRMRRSAGLLMALFASHLTMVAGGVVCVVPGMQPMAGTASADASRPMAGMPGMPGMAGLTAENPTANLTLEPTTDAGASKDEVPCSGPASGSCTAAMPCITALGADQGAPVTQPPLLNGSVETVAVLMPASSGFAPDIPPPRA